MFVTVIEHSLIFEGLARSLTLVQIPIRAMSRVGSSLVYKLPTRAEVTDSVKHSGLFQYGISYVRKYFCAIGFFNEADTLESSLILIYPIRKDLIPE